MAKYVGLFRIFFLPFIVFFLVGSILIFFKTPFIYAIICCVIGGIMWGGAERLYKLKKKKQRKKTIEK
jgi:hypothetical protein